MPELLGKFFVPARFQLTPLFNLTDTVIGVVAAALFAWLIVRIGGRANRKVQFGLLWALLCILPVMVFRNADAQYIFDYLYHRAYLPSIGLIIVLAELLNRLGLRNERYFQRIAIGAVPVLAYCAIASFHELGFYRDGLTFFNEAIVRTPRNALCYNNRAVYYGNERHDHEAALKDFNKAIELNPKYMVAIANRGVTRGSLGQKEEAIADLQRALAINPNSPNPDFILRIADLRYVLNDFTGSIADYNRLQAMDRLYPRIYSKRAGSEAMLGQAEEAIRDADKAVQIDPKDEEAYNSRGLANRLLGRLDEAVNDFSLAIHLKDDYSQGFASEPTCSAIDEDISNELRMGTFLALPQFWCNVEQVKHFGCLMF